MDNNKKLIGFKLFGNKKVPSLKRAKEIVDEIGYELSIQDLKYFLKGCDSEEEFIECLNKVK